MWQFTALFILRNWEMQIYNFDIDILSGNSFFLNINPLLHNQMFLHNFRVKCFLTV